MFIGLGPGHFKAISYLQWDIKHDSANAGSGH